MKDFDTWNKLKKKIQAIESGIACSKGEIWWTSIGVNVGSEQDGKNSLFERPVLILNRFGKDLLRVVPLTSKATTDRFGLFIEYSERMGFVLISQVKTISVRRLTRRLCRLHRNEFQKVINNLIRSIEF